MPTRAKAWKSVIQANNLIDLPQAKTIFNMERLRPIVEYAISDSGATAHFLVEGAPAVNVQKATNLLQITLQNGKQIKSAHTCNLDIPWLPQNMTEAYIVPGLVHSSLILTQKFCDADCIVVFDKYECRVYYGGGN